MMSGDEAFGISICKLRTKGGGEGLFTRAGMTTGGGGGNRCIVLGHRGMVRCCVLVLWSVVCGCVACRGVGYGVYYAGDVCIDLKYCKVVVLLLCAVVWYCMYRA